MYVGHVTTIVHFSDLHLDSPFAWAGASGDSARRRRQALRETLGNIIELAGEVRADALFCGGDLYEHERVTPDTAEFLRVAFAKVSPVPVLLAPGNHDWYGPESIYALNRWSDNVHVFTRPRLEPVEIGSGVTVWGAAHNGPAITTNFLDGFRARGDGAHVALFHGSERSWWADQGGDKAPHAPFDAAQIGQSGLSHAFLGHYHRPKDAPGHTYPGNPDPLEFGEDGERGAVVATIHPDGVVGRERRRVGVSEVHDLVLDISGCSNQQQVRSRLGEMVEGLRGVARLTVAGELQPTLDLNTDDLRDTMSGLDAVQVRIGDIRPIYDIESIRSEPTVKGRFVADVLAAGLDDPDLERRVLVTGLRALEGRTDLEAI